MTARVALAALVVLGALLAAVAAAEWAGWPFLRQPLAQQLSQMAGVPVRIDQPFRIQLLRGLAVAAGAIQVAAPEGAGVPVLLSATGLKMSLRWADAWATVRGRGVRIHELRADTLSAHLLRLADGRASWQLGSETGAAPAVQVPAPVIDRLAVKQARVVLDDRVQQLRLNLQVDPLPAAHLPGRAPGLGASGRGGAGGNATGAASGNAGGHAKQGATDAPPLEPVRISAQGLYRRAEVKAQFDVDDMLSLFTPYQARQPASRVEGQATVGRARLKFDGVLGGLAEAPVLDGEVHAQGPSLGLVMEPLGMTLPQTPPFSVRGTIRLEGPVWTLVAQPIHIGSSRLAGRFAYDTQRKPGLLTGQLTGALLALQDLAPSVGAQALPSVGGRVLPQKKLDIPSLNGMDAEVDFAIDRVDFGTAAIAPLSDLRVKLDLRAGLLKLEDLSAQVAGGTVRGNSSLRAQGEQAQWQLALRLRGIAVSQWLRSLRRSPGTAVRAAVADRPAPQAAAAPAASAHAAAASATAAPAVALASGSLNARLTLAGSGRSVAEVLASADGQIQAALTGGTMSHLLTELAGLDLADSLGVLLRGDKALALRCARVQAPAVKGLVGPVQGVVDNTDSVIRVDGQIDLRTETLALRLRAEPKDLSLLSLRSPVRVGGSLAKPRLSVDAGAIAAKVLGAVALGAVAPILAWLPLLDAGETEAEDPCASGRKKPGAATPPAAVTPRAEPSLPGRQ